jgi:hypothetical protein
MAGALFASVIAGASRALRLVWLNAGYHLRHFRREEPEKFWRWMRAALETAPASADMAPLFRLCWSWSEQAELILARAIPERPGALRQYLSFLLGAARLEAAQARASPSPTETPACRGRSGVEVGEGGLCPACRDFFGRLRAGAAGAPAADSVPVGRDPPVLLTVETVASRDDFCGLKPAAAG